MVRHEERIAIGGDAEYRSGWADLGLLAHHIAVMTEVDRGAEFCPQSALQRIGQTLAHGERIHEPALRPEVVCATG